jgi:cell division transport system permease protein
MKIQSVRYLTREGFRNVWVNRLMSVASVGVLVACMILIGMAILLTKNVDATMSTLEQQNVVMAYFNDKNSVIYQGENATADLKVSDSDYLIHNEEEAKAVCKELEKIDNVASVEFISSDEALERAKDTVLKDQAGAFEIFEEEGGNPMSHGARITLVSMEEFDKTVSAVKKTTGVHSVVSHGELAKTISDIKSGIAMICFWIIGILGVISLVIVSNTIRVTMYNRKLEISIMKAVGATDAFVRLPFIIEGMILGLLSAIISEGLLYFCYRVAGEAMGGSFKLSIPFADEAWLLFGIFALIGIVAGALGSFIMIGKYLRKEGSEFRAL